MLTTVRQDSRVSIDRYAAQQAATLLRRMAYQAARASKSRNPEPVHDLRVAIRRFSQCLRVFETFFPRRETKKIRRELKLLMKLAAGIRNRDICIEFLSEAGIAPDSPLVRGVADERRDQEQLFRSALKSWRQRNFFRQWRARLGL